MESLELFHDAISGVKKYNKLPTTTQSLAKLYLTKPQERTAEKVQIVLFNSSTHSLETIAVQH